MEKMKTKRKNYKNIKNSSIIKITIINYKFITLNILIKNTNTSKIYKNGSITKTIN
jgi:hypothetical protein